jgi:hypothetical protein
MKLQWNEGNPSWSIPPGILSQFFHSFLFQTSLICSNEKAYHDGMRCFVWFSFDLSISLSWFYPPFVFNIVDMSCLSQISEHSKNPRRGMSLYGKQSFASVIGLK